MTPERLAQIQQKYIRLGVGVLPENAVHEAYRNAGFVRGPTSERGMRPNTVDALRYQYQYFGVDPAFRAKVADIREMDDRDARVKKIHGRMARTITKGGLQFKTKSSNKRIIRLWNEYSRRLKLSRLEKLESDARGLIMEGNLPMQWVLNDSQQVIAGIRMPADSIAPVVNGNGQFKDPAAAYEQWDYLKGQVIARFGLWQLSMVRLTPNNFDDMGSLGRPYLDSSRAVWSQLMMTEEDLVIRRRMRAPLRVAHILEGAGEDEVEKYRAQVERDQASGAVNDYYLNTKGSVVPVQGDANLNQIADVAYLLDTFFAGAPAPKGLFGYSGDLQRDVLEDMKKDYFDEIDALQDTQSFVYELGFRLVVLAGINPDAYDFDVEFAMRRTDTPNQRADLALKYQALGVSKQSVLEAAGIDPTKEKDRMNDQASGSDPYPDLLPEESANTGKPNVSVTPGNERKGESATTISTRSKQ